MVLDFGLSRFFDFGFLLRPLSLAVGQLTVERSWEQVVVTCGEVRLCVRRLFFFVFVLFDRHFLLWPSDIVVYLSGWRRE